MHRVEDGFVPDQKPHVEHRWISVLNGRVMRKPHEGENHPAIAIEYGEAVVATHFPQLECEMIDEESRRGGHVGNAEM